MLTVRFPNGAVLVYNDANYVVWGDGGWNLYRSKECKHWVAAIQPSAGCVVEGTRPCSIHSSGNPMDMLKDVTRRVRDHDAGWSYRDALIELKRLLAREFDARTGSWKEEE